MSNLILPQQFENPILEANLKAFFKRYPYEKVRLEHLLSKPVEDRPVVQIELPAVQSTPPMRVLLLAGISSPHFLANLLNDPLIQAETFQSFLVENNADFLAWMFQKFNLTEVINYPKIEWLLMYDEESIKPAFFRILKQEFVASMMRNVFILETNVPQPEDVTAFYKKLPSIYDETVHHVLHNFGNIKDSLLGVQATLMNKNHVLDNPGIEDLKGRFKGMPALIVGAGPTLDDDLQTIKAHNNKFLVICADAALKPLIEAGIRVDYVTSIERMNDYQKPFFERLEPLSSELVAFPVLKPEIFDIFPGKKRVCYRNYSFFAYFQKNWPKGIIKCGGSTSHLATRLADWMGCSKAYLTGIASCYQQKPGTDLYRSHCSGTGYQAWGEYVTLDTLTNIRNHLPPIKALNNLNEEVTTNITYYQWAKEYAEEVAEIGQRMQIVNCSAQGLRMAQIPYRSLASEAAKLDDIAIEKPLQSSVLYNRVFEHKEIVTNFKVWSTMSEEVILECDELLALAEIPTDRFEVLNYVYNFKLAIDPLFVAFIVQCCAKEFFDLENKWWAYSRNMEADRKEKTAVMKERFQLFKNVLDQTIQIFKEYS